MPIDQERMRNPFGMDESCRNCPALAAERTAIVHGYGDVAADFLFVADAPTRSADRANHPLASNADGYALVDLLDASGFTRGRPDGPPRLDNAFVTHLTRCRHPDRPATNEEVAECKPFLNAELRSINPQLIVPVGSRPLDGLVAEHTTEDPGAITLPETHARSIRGRGFELLPTIAPASMNDGQFEQFIDAVESTLGRDYRQTKGRRDR